MSKYLVAIPLWLAILSGCNNISKEEAIAAAKKELIADQWFKDHCDILGKCLGVGTVHEVTHSKKNFCVLLTPTGSTDLETGVLFEKQLYGAIFVCERLKNNVRQ